ncbi:MAG: mRNA 3'-end-processing protein rna14 [Candelina mexicana]|nr:MAG: mRNA 3'-end-processing protein rna14 [Candelina mexicana]
MADMDAQMAFFNSMRTAEDTVGNYGEQAGGFEKQQEDNLSTEDHAPSQDVKNASFVQHADDSTRGAQASLSPSSSSSFEPAQPNINDTPQQATANSFSVDNSAQHPPTLGHTSTDLSRSASRTSFQNPSSALEQTQKPRTLGGFIVDDDDEDNNQAPFHVMADASHGASSSIGVVSAFPTDNSLSLASGSVVSTDSVPLQKAAEDKGVPNVAQGGVAHTVPNLAAVIPDTGASASDDSIAKPSKTLPAPSVIEATNTGNSTPGTTLPKARLPHDRVGILEDRIKDDPRGDMDAWVSLINEHQKRNKLEDARRVYDSFFKVFPSAAEQWVEYVDMELKNNEFWRVEQIFNQSLLAIPNIQFWSVYLDYVRRRNNLTTDTAGTARQIVSQAYDFVLQNIGGDKDSGSIWQDYVQFIRTGPGIIGGGNWQDQQKMDLLRKTYQRAICVPTQAVNTLWKEYDSFEMGLNKTTGRRFLQEKSPAYMSARSSYIELQNLTRGLNRTTMPSLPPALGFDGDLEYLKQIDLWKKWIQWEKDDPLVLKDEDPTAYRARIVYVFKQAVMALRFWPEMWFDASEFCFEAGLEKDGNEFLTQGVSANPESCLLAFKHADRLESTTSGEEGEENIKRRGSTVREPYDKVLQALYELIAKAKTREAQDIARVEEAFSQAVIARASGIDADDEEDNLDDSEQEAKEAAKNAQVGAIQKGSAVQINLLSRTITFVWIALMRAMRRVQGKGKVDAPVGGSRQIFTDARKRGKITTDLYVASALIEYHCYKDPVATKIFERGLKLFPNDENFALEYLKHLIAINDVTNARVVFETTVSKFVKNPETMNKAKPLYAFFHEYEAHYGELNQVRKLEKRIGELFPEDPQLLHFARRFTTSGFDPSAIRPIISPATQARAKTRPSIENVPPGPNSPHNQIIQSTDSPKRPLPPDESESEANPPRKLARGESPLKGAAGRRLDQHKRTRERNDVPEHQTQRSAQAPPALPLPRDVLFLLSIIPKAETYQATKFKAEGMVRLLRETNIPN